MLRTGDPLLERSKGGGEVTAQQGAGIQPEAGEEFTPIDSQLVRLQPLEAPFPQDEPIQSSFRHAPDEILSHPTAAVDVALLVQIVGHAARRYPHRQLRRAFQVIIRVY